MPGRMVINSLGITASYKALSHDIRPIIEGRVSIQTMYDLEVFKSHTQIS